MLFYDLQNKEELERQVFILRSSIISILVCSIFSCGIGQNLMCALFRQYIVLLCYTLEWVPHFWC